MLEFIGLLACFYLAFKYLPEFLFFMIKLCVGLFLLFFTFVCITMLIDIGVTIHVT